MHIEAAAKAIGKSEGQVIESHCTTKTELAFYVLYIMVEGCMGQKDKINVNENKNRSISYF